MKKFSLFIFLLLCLLPTSKSLYSSYDNYTDYDYYYDYYNEFETKLDEFESYYDHNYYKSHNEEEYYEVYNENILLKDNQEDCFYTPARGSDQTYASEWESLAELFATTQDDPLELSRACKDQLYFLVLNNIAGHGTDLRNIVNEAGENILHWAARGGPAGKASGCKLPLVRYLTTGKLFENDEIDEFILQYPLVKATDYNGNLPIHAALPVTLESDYEIHELMTLLLDNNAELVNRCNNLGESSLEKAYIITCADDDSQFSHSTQILETMLSLIQGRPKVLKKYSAQCNVLSELDVNYEQINDDNSELLAYYAIRDGRIDLLNTILQRTTDNIPEELLKNPYIHCAVECKSLEGLKSLEYILAKQPSSINQETSDGLTPLYVAAQNNNQRAVKTLIKHGGNLGSKGRELLHELCQKNHYTILKKLLKNMSNEEKDTYANQERAITSSPLYSAIINCSLESVEVLLHYKIKYNKHSFFGSPLYVAGKTLERVKYQLNERDCMHKIIDALHQDASHRLS